MASPPETPDEPTALAGAPDQVRRARIGRHAKPAVVLLAIALILLLANGHYGWISGVPGSKPTPIDAATPTVIDEPFAPKALRPLSPTQAEAWNRQIPQTGQVSAATPIVVAASDPQSFVRSLQCMTEAIYYEAGNEPIDGQRAVAQVILNRMRSSVYPHSVCGVVYQGSERKTGCQFTFTCDGSLARAPARASWDRATGIAAAALSGSVYAPVGWATNYHADYVVPYWAQSLVKLTTVGRHIFYGWKGVSGTGAAFTSRYAGIEPNVLGALNMDGQQAPVVTSEPGAIVSVTSAERPLIRFGLPPAGEVGTKALSGKAAEPVRPDVSLGSRWIIGGPRKPLDNKSSDTRTVIPEPAKPTALATQTMTEAVQPPTKPAAPAAP
jgi:spore germination cell wall hydrolase CwlJ-like protein